MSGVLESFFGALKNELVYRTVYPTRGKARRAIAEYINMFYNRQRLHSGLGYKTPWKSPMNTCLHWTRLGSTRETR